MMYQYNVQYVMVVPAGGQTNLGSDLGKAVWMIRISSQYTEEFGIVNEDYFDESTGSYVDKFYDSVLFRLMAYRTADMDTNQAQKPPFGNDNSALAPELRANEVTSLDFFTEVWRSKGIHPDLPGDYPIIRIFRVNYPADIDLRVNDFNQIIDENLEEIAERNNSA